jgi:CheY-like chemotaxis protein
MSKFRLIGHSCPANKYPSVVLPVGKIGARIVVLYQGSAESEEEINPKASFVRYETSLPEALANFDPVAQRLFAYSENEVIPYNKDAEADFFQEFLSNTRFADVDPFFRFSFARRTQDSATLLREIGACLRALWTEAPRFSASWIENEALSAIKETSSQNASAAEESKVLARFWGWPEPGSEPEQIRRLLVIDDDQVYCAFLKDHLELSNYRVQTATDAASGLKEMFQWMPHLIILDYRMPGLDGGGFLDLLDREQGFRDIPVIVLTANAEAFETARKKFQNVPILQKPTPIDKLSKQVELILAKKPVSWPGDLTQERLATYQGAQRRVDAALVGER